MAGMTPLRKIEYLPSSRFSFLKSARRTLKKLLRKPEGQSGRWTLSCPILDRDPAGLSRGVVALKGDFPSGTDHFEFCLNGELVSFQLLSRKENIVSLAADSRFFEPYENILGIPREFNARVFGLCGEYNGDEPPGLKRQALQEDLPSQEAAIGYLKRSVNDLSGSRFRGTVFACYDLDAGAYRLNSWVWCSAAVVRALLEQGDIESTSHVARSILSHQISGGEHNGAIEVRWDLDPAGPEGIIRWLAPNDSAFCGSYAFLPMYRATGDPLWLEAATRIAEWIVASGTDESGLLKVGYQLERSRWEDSWLYVDAGFTATLYQDLLETTGNTVWKDQLDRFIRRYLEVFDSGRVYLNAIWRRDGSHDRGIFTRGQAWALDGLLAAVKGLEDARYLDYSRRIADFLLENQRANGSWEYRIGEASGECAKATPIIAYHLLELAKLTQMSVYQDSAVKALDWCRSHQYFGPDSAACGGIHARSEEGAIAGAHGADVIFTYSVAYYLMALGRLNANDIHLK